MRRRSKRKTKKERKLKISRLLGLSPDMFSVKSLNRHLGFIVFVAFLALVYIGNTHYAEKNKWKLYQSQKEIQHLRWEYMTIQSQLMDKSKQTEVAKVVGDFGLRELTSPPKTISVEY